MTGYMLLDDIEAVDEFGLQEDEEVAEELLGLQVEEEDEAVEELFGLYVGSTTELFGLHVQGAEAVEDSEAVAEVLGLDAEEEVEAVEESEAVEVIWNTWLHWLAQLCIH